MFYSSVDLPAAIVSKVAGKKVIVSMNCDIGQLKLEELSNLAKAGAVFLIEEEEEMEEKQPAITVTAVEEPSKKTVGGGGKRVDTGKIKALKDAGWSAAKIADEMGVSVQAVYNHIKKMEEKR